MSFLRNLFGKQEGAGGFQRKVERRISTLKTIGTSEPGESIGQRGKWRGVFVSKEGGTIKDLAFDVEIPAGEWLYFLYQYRYLPLPDNRIIFSDAACFWVEIPTPFDWKGGSYYPIPEEIKSFIIEDGNYAEWKGAFHAIEDYFSQDKDTKYQWSWRTDRVKRFVAGECPDWVSNSFAKKLESGTERRYFSVHCPYCGSQKLYKKNEAVYCDNEICPNGKNPVDIDRYNLRRFIS